MYRLHSNDFTHLACGVLVTLTKPSRHSQPGVHCETQFLGGFRMFAQVVGQRDMQPLKREFAGHSIVRFWNGTVKIYLD